jgi:hypothetical protein
MASRKGVGPGTWGVSGAGRSGGGGFGHGPGGGRLSRSPKSHGGASQKRDGSDGETFDGRRQYQRYRQPEAADEGERKSGDLHKTPAWAERNDPTVREYGRRASCGGRIPNGWNGTRGLGREEQASAVCCCRRGRKAGRASLRPRPAAPATARVITGEHGLGRKQRPASFCPGRPRFRSARSPAPSPPGPQRTPERRQLRRRGLPAPLIWRVLRGA